MSAINDGGPAFPAPAGVQHITLQGMTLRDYFAARAMQSIARSMLSDGTKTRYDIAKLDHLQCVALDAYAIADAMLAARGKEAKP